MSIKDYVINNFKKGYLNTNVPCNDLLKESIYTNMGIHCDVLVRNNECIVIRFNFEDAIIDVECKLRQSVNGYFYIKEIKSE